MVKFILLDILFIALVILMVGYAINLLIKISQQNKSKEVKQDGRSNKRNKRKKVV